MSQFVIKTLLLKIEKMKSYISAMFIWFELMKLRLLKFEIKILYYKI